MSAPRTIPPEARRVQVEAADPEVSAFVSANAGSGKTHVLAQRVINLLLKRRRSGQDPLHHLHQGCGRQYGEPRVQPRWRTGPRSTTPRSTTRSRFPPGDNRTPRKRARARRLFASALETPGGLKVQTIHAFCTRLLHQFPFEANVAARFTVLDEASTTQLLDQLTLQVLLEASAEPDSALGRALASAIVVAADQTFKDVIGETIVERDALEQWLKRAGGVDAAIAELSASFGVDPNDTLESVEQEFFSRLADPADRMAGADRGSRLRLEIRQQRRSTRCRPREPRPDASASTIISTVFCTAELEPRKNIITKKLADRHPDWLARLQAEQDRISALLARERAVQARERTRALVTIAAEVIARYTREKERRALLDYDDLIDKTLPLLSDGASRLGALQARSRHRPRADRRGAGYQPQAVADHPPAGVGIRARRRARQRQAHHLRGRRREAVDLLVSGRGAARLRRDAPTCSSEQFSQPELGWRYLRFHHSFRSGENVLSSVDQVFRAQEIYRSVTTDAVGIPEHKSLPDAAPGLVELWPLVAPAEKKEIEGWDAPFDTESEQSPRVLLARRIAAHVRRWMARGLKAGDVLVLVRQRGPLFEAVIRALKNAGVPVAGADRLMLTEHIAVMDLMALADCLLLPDDDLALAGVLRSPLFGITEEQLFELAWQRKTSLRDALRAKASDDVFFAAVNGELDGLARQAQTHTPFGFFAHVLGARHGRAKFLARLGPEANDALDEFLNLALDYEARETPSLQGFLAWLRAARSEVRRDMEMARDEVRVMTVHGAKGLEANTVILADTTHRSERRASAAAAGARQSGALGLGDAHARTTPRR